MEWSGRPILVLDLSLTVHLSRFNHCWEFRSFGPSLFPIVKFTFRLNPTAFSNTAKSPNQPPLLTLRTLWWNSTFNDLQYHVMKLSRHGWISQSDHIHQDSNQNGTALHFASVYFRFWLINMFEASWNLPQWRNCLAAGINTFHQRHAKHCQEDTTTHCYRDGH